MAYKALFAAFAIVVVTYVIASYVSSIIAARRFAKEHNCKPAPKFPQSETIIGYQAFKTQTKYAKNNTFLEHAVKRYEMVGANTFTVSALGRAFIHTIDEDNVKAILATNFKDFGLGSREKNFGPLLGRGIFTMDGPAWEHSRALVRPSFNKTQVADLNTFETHISTLISKIPRDGSTVDLQKLFFQLTLDSASEFLFGESVNSLNSVPGSKEQNFGIAFDYAQAELGTRARLGMFLFLYKDKRFFESCKIAHDFVDEIVYRGLAHHARVTATDDIEKATDKEKYVFLYELTKATTDPRQLRDELLNILVAGRDTTATLLSNVLHVLARRPDIWAKLQAEISTLNGKKPTYESLRGLRYLKYVLNESLRLHAVVPTNARKATRNTTLPRGGGPDGLSPVFVKKDQIVVYTVWAMHRRKDIYGEDADEFKPERWEKLRPGWGYLPFNGGPRICVGQQFAITEASYTLVRLLQAFKRIENRDDSPWVEKLALTVTSKKGVQVALFKE